MIAKQRYQGIQSIFGVANGNACLFLCMLSIAEEYLGRDIDFINAYYTAINNNCMDQTFYLMDQEKLLYLLTNKKWKKTILSKLPEPVPSKMYTVEQWHNPRTNFTHYKRRGYDTLVASKTVAEGKLVQYYCYTVE